MCVCVCMSCALGFAAHVCRSTCTRCSKLVDKFKLDAAKPDIADDARFYSSLLFSTFNANTPTLHTALGCLIHSPIPNQTRARARVSGIVCPVLCANSPLSQHLAQVVVNSVGGNVQRGQTARGYCREAHCTGLNVNALACVYCVHVCMH